jgi:Ni/Fe-hydrogenase subunit HybB-like protein
MPESMPPPGREPEEPSPEESAAALDALGVHTLRAATQSELRTMDRRLDERVFRAMQTVGVRYVLLAGFLTTIVAIGLFAWGYQVFTGIGVAGIRRPVFWGFYITNFVFWIGISHSGTLVSAILRVLNVEWRRPLTRAAEAMTLFALMIGGLFPIIHLGRPWRFYWMIPIPNERALWPNFRSALMWDLLAILTYITTSTLFLYLPLIPDLAAVRDRTGGIKRKLYGVLSLGWRGTQQEWHRLHLGMRVLTIVVIPVAVSVHSIVSWDFGMTIVEGWRSSVFAPYFVIGAIYSGIAALITVLVLVRRALKLEEYLTLRHLDRMGKVLLAVSVIWFYMFWAGFLTDWYSGNANARELQEMHMFGEFAPLFWGMLAVNMVIPFLTLWFKRVRTSPALMLIITLLINVGMWVERFLIVVTSPMRNGLSYNWGSYWPRWPELAITAATFAAFALLYVVFSKALPLISLWETKEGWHVDRWRREGVVEDAADLPEEAPGSLDTAPARMGGGA